MVDGSARKSRPSHIDIAKYWHERDPRFVFDLREPSCFACGWWRPEGKDEEPAPWHKAGLERCHIVAKSIGGSMDPSNFLLLCPQCHKEAPMCSDPEVMLKWARTRPSHCVRMMAQLEEELGRLRIDPREIDIDSAEKFGAFLRQLKVDRHPRSGCGDALVPVMVQMAHMYSCGNFTVAA